MKVGGSRLTQHMPGWHNANCIGREFIILEDIVKLAVIRNNIGCHFMIQVNYYYDHAAFSIREWSKFLYVECSGTSMQPKRKIRYVY